MNKKRWALVVLLGLVLFGYIKLFYKTYAVTAVAANADCIVALDVKRITNTILWNMITTPGQWKKISFSSGKKNEVSWKDMVKVPDYVLAFHVKEQPFNTWYLVLQVKDENDFARGLQFYHFKQLDSNRYAGKDYPCSFFKQGDKILVTNDTSENNTDLPLVANELFIQKKYIVDTILEKVIAAKSHVAVYFSANNFLQDATVVSGNFDKTKIELSCALSPKKQFSFTENNCSYSSGSLCTLGFTQPSPSIFNLFSTADKDNISKALNLDIDSLFLQSNKYYHLDLAAIKPRIDSAITYSYDDDFNKVEKRVVNTVQEPAFNFTITGDSVANIFSQWQHSKKLEPTDEGQLFTAMPFVKSYCKIKPATELNITAANYEAAATDKNTIAVFFLNILLGKIPGNLQKYLPDDIIHATANIESMQLKANKEKEQLNITCLFQKKANDLPVISW